MLTVFYLLAALPNLFLAVEIKTKVMRTAVYISLILIACMNISYTLVERKSRNAIVLQTNGKNALATYEALKKLKEHYKESFSQIFKSITLDNGSEFAASNEFESLGTTIYYAHPYSTWKRGQNEHFNGLLRRFIPKGKDLSYMAQNDLNRFANMLNNLPRRKLNYSTPADLFNNEISAIISAQSTPYEFMSQGVRLNFQSAKHFVNQQLMKIFRKPN